MNDSAYWDKTYRRELAERRVRAHEHVWQRLLSTIPDMGLLVDVGCGTGEFLRWLRAQRPWLPLVGLDHSAAALDYAREIEGREGGRTGEVGTGHDKRLLINFVDCGAYKLKVPDNTAKVVYSGHLLEHLDDPVKALREQRRIARKGGTIIVHFPHEDQPYVEHVHQVSFGKVMGWMEAAGIRFDSHSDVIAGRPTNDGIVWGKK